jgi:hypothetical protein
LCFNLIFWQILVLQLNAQFEAFHFHFAFLFMIQDGLVRLSVFRRGRFKALAVALGVVVNPEV